MSKKSKISKFYPISIALLAFAQLLSIFFIFLLIVSNCYLLYENHVNNELWQEQATVDSLIQVPDATATSDSQSKPSL
jgi:hypothetical protein